MLAYAFVVGGPTSPVPETLFWHARTPIHAFESVQVRCDAENDSAVLAGMGGGRAGHGGCALGVMLAETQRRSCRSRKSVFLSSDGASLGGYPMPAPQIEIEGWADGSQKLTCVAQ